VENLIDQIGDFLSGIAGLASAGFDGVNQVMGLIIAIFFFIKTLLTGTAFRGRRRVGH